MSLHQAVGFPALSLGNFHQNPSNLVSYTTVQTQKCSQNDKIPCRFPEEQGIRMVRPDRSGLAGAPISLHGNGIFAFGRGAGRIPALRLGVSPPWQVQTACTRPPAQIDRQTLLSPAQDRLIRGLPSGTACQSIQGLNRTSSEPRRLCLPGMACHSALRYIRASWSCNISAVSVWVSRPHIRTDSSWETKFSEANPLPC